MPEPLHFRPAWLAQLMLAAVLAGCSVGPDYVRPESAVPERFSGAAEAPGAAAAGAGHSAAPLATAGDPAFWRGFGDSRLNVLVEEALGANHDVRAAVARYDEANALLRGAGLDRYPTVTANAQAGNGRASESATRAVPGASRDIETYRVGLDASWELDAFGRVRRAIEAQRADAMASAADIAAVQVAIVGEVARTYFGLRGLQERLRVARGNAGNQRETLSLVDARWQAGRGTDFDMARARAQLETTSARIPALEARVGFAMNRLAVLLGRTPGSLAASLGKPAPLPSLPERLDPGTPGELLRRRPDVAAAEQRLHGATARIGVATADLFPRFTLGGLIGSEAIDAGALFERGSGTRLIALGIDWSFLDTGRVRARMAAADARASGALANYEQTVLLALEETENALLRFARARGEDAHLEQAAIESTDAARLSRVRFDAGAADLLDVLDAERTQLQAQDAFADSRARSVISAVDLYEALAGGWPRALPPRASAPDD